jgi:hypothetical protein
MHGNGITNQQRNNLNTNYAWLAKDVDLPDDVVLWVLYHPRRHDVTHAQEKCSVWPHAKKIILLDQEGWFDGPEFEFDSRITLYDSVTVDHPQMRTWLYWFRETILVDKFTNLSSECKPWHNKNCDYMFDSLLGTMWPNKSFVQQKIDQSVFKDCFLQGTRQPHYMQIDNDWVGGGGYSTATSRLEYRPGQQTDIAVFVPSTVYNNSWYSIVAESYRSRVFLTEKTAKPMIAKRLFVSFGHQHTLKVLKGLGFRTFDAVIDESYDNIADDTTRWQAAWQQVELLMQTDPKLVYEQIQSVIDHNYQHITQTNWYDLLVNSIRHELTRD